MNKRFKLGAAVAATAAVLTSAPYVSATPEQTSSQPAITQVKTVATFDFTAGDAPENITINPDHSATLSMLGAPAGKRPELVRITPSGQRTVLAVGQRGDQITGNTRGSDGTIYYNVQSSHRSRNGVWKLPPSGTPQRMAALPADGIPNGLAIDPGEQTLYVADSLKSTVWAVPVQGGPATAWLTDPALAPDPYASLPLGANGLRFHNGAVWVSNFNKGTLLRIPVTPAGAAARIHTVTSSLTAVDDFSFLNDRSDVVFATENDPTDQVSVVYPNGTTKTALTASDGLASPTATAVSGRQLYITNAGLTKPHDAKLQRGDIKLRALFSSPLGR
ncbi:SMP-30/gluconolactonase/LRE family protein [Streptomyces sp. NPDC006372]|uniref:SMP-30/gluconolactonase/LRE family protein n=1 Tax=Streptomyces sp. NPDC006372 TaxID=3155599 RepID=UPI0033AA0751